MYTASSIRPLYTWWLADPFRQMLQRPYGQELIHDPPEEEILMPPSERVRDGSGTTALNAFLNNADMIDLSSCPLSYCVKVRP